MNWTTTTTIWLNHTPQQQHQPNFSTMWHHNPNPNKKFFKENTTTRPQHYFSSKCNPICGSTTISPQVWSKLWSLLGKTNYNPNHNQNLWKVNTITTIFFLQKSPPQPQFFGHHNPNPYHNFGKVNTTTTTTTQFLGKNNPKLWLSTTVPQFYAYPWSAPKIGEDL